MSPEYEPHPMSSTFPPKSPRFTKKTGKVRVKPIDYRLTDAEHQTLARLMLEGRSSRRERLEAWAHALETTLTASERIKTKSHLNWLAYRLRAGQRMLLRDAALIMVAGMRTNDPRLDSNYDWQMALNEHLPVIGRFHHGYGVPGRFAGIWDGPFEPVLVPRAYVETLADELSKVAMPRDKGGKRRPALGARLQTFLNAKFTAQPPQTPWNSSASFAIQNIALSVLFREFYRGRFGAYTAELDAAVNEAGYAIGRAVERMLADEQPGAYQRLSERLAEEVAAARGSRSSQTA